MGRRRRFNTWEPKNYDLSKSTTPVRHNDAENEWGTRNIKRAKTHTALNAVSQGTAADIAKKAMLDIWNSGVCDIVGVPLTLVHDEINFSVPHGKEGDEAIAEVKRLMENTVQLKVPLMVGVSEGADWGECK
jgi:DNA polymerase-1